MTQAIMTPKEFKKIRSELGISQRELGEILNLAKNGDRTIRRIEAGEYEAKGSLVRCLEYYVILKKNNIDISIKN